MNNPLAKLNAATRALAEAKSLDDVKKIHDIAQAAETYARAAKLGLEAQNHAAEVKLRAERKAGELLARLERNIGGDRKSISNVGHCSEFSRVLDETQTTRQDASRWQKECLVPDEKFESYIAENIKTKELTSTGVLRIAKEIERENKRQENADLIASTPPLEAVVGQRFKTIVIDPPWSPDDEGDVDQFGRTQPTYGTMTIEEIMDLPVSEFAENNCHLYLWITNRSLPKGFCLIEKWGFRYVTALTWIKPSIGIGNYFRNSTEHILFGVRGSLSLLRADQPTHFEAQRPNNRRHSAKPEESYQIVEACSPSPWIQIFGGDDRPGWSRWGALAVKK